MYSSQCPRLASQSNLRIETPDTRYLESAESLHIACSIEDESTYDDPRKYFFGESPSSSPRYPPKGIPAWRLTDLTPTSSAANSPRGSDGTSNTAGSDSNTGFSPPDVKLEQGWQTAASQSRQSDGAYKTLHDAGSAVIDERHLVTSFGTPSTRSDCSSSPSSPMSPCLSIYSVEAQPGQIANYPQCPPWPAVASWPMASQTYGIVFMPVYLPSGPTQIQPQVSTQIVHACRCKQPSVALAVQEPDTMPVCQACSRTVDVNLLREIKLACLLDPFCKAVRNFTNPGTNITHGVHELRSYSNGRVFVWVSPTSKLDSRDKEMASSEFMVPGFRLKMMVLAKDSSLHRHGKSFKKSKGNGYFNLKCISQDPDAGMVSFRTMVTSLAMEDNQQQPPRGPFQHDFSQNVVAPADIKSQDALWSFKSCISPSSKFLIIAVEINVAKEL